MGFKRFFLKIQFVLLNVLIKSELFQQKFTLSKVMVEFMFILVIILPFSFYKISLLRTGLIMLKYFFCMHGTFYEKYVSLAILLIKPL